MFMKYPTPPAHAEVKAAVEQMTRAMLASAMAWRSSFDEIKGYG
jgi:hypothetical protein